MYEEITAQARQAVTELVDAAGLRAGELLVIGCSSSEMVGARIGKGSSMEAAQAALDGVARHHGDGGMIVVPAHGDGAMVFNSEMMNCGWKSPKGSYVQS